MCQVLRRAILLVAFMTVMGSAMVADEARGIRLTENTSISPFAEASITHDDNPLLLPPGDELDDIFVDLVIGLSLIRQTDRDNLSIQGWFQRREYSEHTYLNDDSWQERLEYVIGAPDRLQLRLQQRHGVLSDYEFTQADLGAVEERRQATQRLIETRTRRVSRDIDDLSVAVSRETRKINVELRGAYSAVSFDREEDYELFDWQEYHVDPFAGLRISEKTQISLSGSIGRQESDNDLAELEYLRGLVGVRYTPSEKTRLAVGVGAQEHSVPSDPSLDRSAFHFDGKGMWAATEKLAFQCYGRNEYQPTSAFESNTKRVTQGSVGVVYDVTRRIYVTLGPSFRVDDYTAPINGVDARETLKGLKARLVIAGRKRNVKIYLNGRYEEFESNIQDDYTQLRLTIGANVAL